MTQSYKITKARQWIEKNGDAINQILASDLESLKPNASEVAGILQTLETALKLMDEVQSGRLSSIESHIQKIIEETDCPVVLTSAAMAVGELRDLNQIAGE